MVYVIEIMLANAMAIIYKLKGTNNKSRTYENPTSIQSSQQFLKGNQKMD
jgi:predicted ATPase